MMEFAYHIREGVTGWEAWLWKGNGRILVEAWSHKLQYRKGVGPQNGSVWFHVSPRNNRAGPAWRVA